MAAQLHAGLAEVQVLGMHQADPAEGQCRQPGLAGPNLGLILADAGGVGIVIGLATYGYKIIRVLGVKMVHLTFSRGFSVELGAAIVIIVASRYGLPVSSTQVCGS